MKQLHFFICARCGCDKLKEKYNYEQANKAINKRLQPTCSLCLPEVPRFVEKLRVSEMKLYLAEWKCGPVKSDAKKRDVLAVFRAECKKRVKENFFRSHRSKDTGVKVASKPRSLELCYKEWQAKTFPSLSVKAGKNKPLAIALAQKAATSKNPPPPRAPAHVAKPAPAPVIDLYCLDSDSDEEFEFEPSTDSDRCPIAKKSQLDESKSKDLESCSSNDDFSHRTEDLDLSSQQLRELSDRIIEGLPYSPSSSVPTEVMVPQPSVAAGPPSPMKETRAQKRAKTKSVPVKRTVAPAAQLFPATTFVIYNSDLETYEEFNYGLSPSDEEFEF
jgi:hypothetical protein